MLQQIGGFVGGVVISTAFVCNMNDVIYSQMRRNVVMPVKNLFSPPDEKERNVGGDLAQVGKGTLNFMS